MTGDGIRKGLQVLVAAYPSFRPTQHDLEWMASLWKTMLAEYTDAQVSLAIRDWLKTDKKGFAPSIGQIIGMIHTDTKELTEMEAWAMVSRALRNGTYGSEAEYERLPETVQAAVGCPEQLKAWACMDMGEVQSVAQSNFLRSYRAACGRRKMQETLGTGQRIETKAKEQASIADDRYVPMPEEARARLAGLRKETA